MDSPGPQFTPTDPHSRSLASPAGADRAGTIDAALAYAARGWHVLPLAPRAKVPPAGSRGLYDATIDPAVIRTWDPSGNIGIALPPSGLIAIDADGDGWRDRLAALETQHGQLPDTVIQVSGSGAVHLIYGAPDFPIRGQVGGLTLRGVNYIVAAPSVHPNGARYAWLDAHGPGEIAIANLPPAWVDAIRRPAEVGDVAIPDESGEPDWLRDVSADARLSAMRAHLEREDGEAQGVSRAGMTFDVVRSAIRGHAVRDPGAAYALVLDVYNPKCRPPWSTDRLAYKVEQAYASAHSPSWGERLEPATLSRARALAEIGLVPKPALDVVPASPAASVTECADTYGADLRAYLGDDDPGDDRAAWLIEHVLAAGVPQVVAGRPKSRKTFVLEHMLLCVAAGIPWLGRYSTTRSRVLLIPREDREHETRRRIWRLARGLGLDPRELHDWLRIDSRQPFYFSNTADVERMRRTIETWRPAIIAIDSLSRTHQGDENSVKEMGIVTSTWGDLCQRYDVSVAIIHHETKVGEGPLLTRLRGTGDLGALVRHAIGVAKPEPNLASLEFDGNLPGLVEPFNVEIVDGQTATGKPCITLAFKGTAAEDATQRLDRGILTSLAVAQPAGLTVRALEREVTGKAERIRARRDVLKERGHISIHGGRYHITQSGLLALGGPS